MTYKNILQKGAFATLLAGALVVTVSCNDDDVSPVLEEIFILFYLTSGLSCMKEQSLL